MVGDVGVWLGPRSLRSVTLLGASKFAFIFYTKLSFKIITRYTYNTLVDFNSWVALKLDYKNAFFLTGKKGY